MSIAQIVVQIEEMDEGDYQVRMSYSGGNDLETIESKAAFEKIVTAIGEVLNSQVYKKQEYKTPAFFNLN